MAARIAEQYLARSGNLLHKQGRMQLHRVLDPACNSVQLDTLIKAASAVGRDLRISLKPLARA